MRVLIKIN